MKCDKCKAEGVTSSSASGGSTYNFCSTCSGLLDRLQGAWLIKTFIGPGKESEEAASMRLAKIRRELYPNTQWSEIKPIFVE